jgi:metallo-beta-lactamase class B
MLQFSAIFRAIKDIQGGREVRHLKRRHKAVRATLLLFLSGLAAASHAQQATLPEGFTAPVGWTTPFPAHRVIGNLYGVGLADLSVFLITSDEGHILINTGLENSTEVIRNNVESLGFSLDDVRILLCMQAHFDHAAALAEIKALTGAEMWGTVNDTRILEDGGMSDPHFGGRQSFKPVKVDRQLSDGDVIELGDIRLTVHDHPGHTEGSSSYSMTVTENGRDYAVLIANMGTINPGKRMLVEPTYPRVADDFAKTFREQKAMTVDVWVAAHGSQYGLQEKFTPGQSYHPDTFVDPEGFMAEVERLEAIYLEQIAAETRQIQR